MFVIFTKFSIISTLVVIALQLPRLIERVGAWGRVDIHIDHNHEPSDDSNKIVTLKSQLKDAQDEANLAKVSAEALEALATLPSDASQDEKIPWKHRWSFMMKEVIYEIGDKMLEVEPQYFDPGLRLSNQLPAVESAARKCF